MAEENNTTTGKKVRSLDEEIARAAEKLRKLQEQQKEQQKRERERNQKAVLELIKSERLDAVPAEQWKQALPQIKALLITETANSAKPTQSSQTPTMPGQKLTQPSQKPSAGAQEAEATH